MQQSQMFDVYMLHVGELPVWVFALGFSGGYFRYDVRVLDIDETGQVVGLVRLLEYPVEYPVLTDRNLSAYEASQVLVTIKETIEGYRRIASGEMERLQTGGGALAGEPGSIPA